ncbi:MAG: hypothetical protein R2845_11270 [Thermomicrobiales bacterium]
MAPASKISVESRVKGAVLLRAELDIDAAGRRRISGKQIFSPRELEQHRSTGRHGDRRRQRLDVDEFAAESTANRHGTTFAGSAHRMFAYAAAAVECRLGARVNGHATDWVDRHERRLRLDALPGARLQK